MSEPVVTPPEPRVTRRRWRRRVVLALLVFVSVAGLGWYRSGSPRATLAAGDTAHAVAFSPDGTLLATGSSIAHYMDPDRANGVIRLWDAATGRQLASWVAHQHFITDLAFDPSGRTLTSAAVVQSPPPVWEVAVWDLASHQELERTSTGIPPGGFPVASPAGGVIAKHGGWGVLAVCDARTGGELYRLEADRWTLHCAAFSPDGALLATGGGDTSGGGPSPLWWMNGDVRIWEVGTGRLVATLNRHSAPIMGVAFSPDGRSVASASLDGTVKMWTVPGR